MKGEPQHVDRQCIHISGELKRCGQPVFGRITPINQWCPGHRKAGQLQQWQICPKCRDHRIEGGNIEIDELYTWQQLTCTECGATWVETYEAMSRSEYEEA